MNYEGLEENNDYYYENNIGILFSPNINNFSYSSDLNDNFYLCDKLAESENKNEKDPFSNNKLDDCFGQFQHEKKTSCTTNYKNIIRKKCSNYEPPKILDNIKIEEEMPPTLFSFDDIKEKIFMNKDYKEKFSFEANNIFIKDEKLEEPYLNKKRRRDSDFNDSDLYEVLEKENLQYYRQENRIKRGRKPKDGEGWGHDKMSADNIIKKLKAEFFKYMTLFLNKIIKTTTSEENDKILKLDYRFINQLNREIDLKYLILPLKDLFSLDVSPKYRKAKPESNKINIEQILNENPDEAIKFVFNMTFRDWLDVFSYKKTVKELLNEKNIDDDDICKKIEKSLVKVDDLLNKIASNDNKYYFSNFTFYLYNYEIWFYKKKGRKSKKKSNQMDNFEK
jgi:hypothetical protein